MTEPLVSETPIYTNGVYPHESFTRRHRIQVIGDVGGGLVLVLVIAASAAMLVVVLLGAAWLGWNLLDALLRRAA